MRLKLLLASLALSLTGHAEIRLPNILSDHAVLQRDRPVHLWGWAKPHEHLTLTFHAQTLATQADDLGEWEAWLRPESAGGPYKLNISGDASSNKLERSDLLVGDVWFASGQSNMEMPIEGWPAAPIKDSDKEIASATHPQIRLLLQKKGYSAVALNDIAQTWTECTPDTARHFSAVAYFFGRELNSREHVPIGLIDATWGGTPAHAWLSPSAIVSNNLTSIAADFAGIQQKESRLAQTRALYEREDADLKAANLPPATHPSTFGGFHEGGWIPSAIFNAMIAPDTRFTIKGFLWYQGETDSDPTRFAYYSRVFPALITDWRNQWHEGDLPFLFVQISSYNTKGAWGEVRDAQRRTLALANTAMAVTVDVGDAANVHPANKQAVGARLALAARATVYGEHLESSGPLFREATTEPSALRLWFTHAEGLTSHDQPITSFELAGDDGRYLPATARIEKLGHDETIVLSSPQVPTPRSARYAWQGNVTSYFYNSAGLPAGTFTTE